MHSARSFLVVIVFSTLAATGCGIDLINTVQAAFPDDPQSDLRIRLPDGTALTCVAGPSVVVTVENRGDADAPQSITTFVIVPGGSVDVQTSGLGQSDSIQLGPVTVPDACFVPDCRFTVLADASFQVDETDESNNRLDGNCPASAAPAQ